MVNKFFGAVEKYLIINVKFALNRVKSCCFLGCESIGMLSCLESVAVKYPK